MQVRNVMVNNEKYNCLDIVPTKINLLKLYISCITNSMYVISGPPSISHCESPGSISGLPIWYLGRKSDIGICCCLTPFGLSLTVLIHIRLLYYSSTVP